jgi:hypothetical protein
MCDLQLLTGIAILISAFITVPCTMSAYHWQIVVYLAWFSSVVHLSGLIAARRYLYGRPWERLVRIIASVVFLAVLVVAMVPTGYFNWNSADGQITADMDSSVKCLFDPSYGPSVWRSGNIQGCLGRLDEFEDVFRSQHPEIDLDSYIDGNDTGIDSLLPKQQEILEIFRGDRRDWCIDNSTFSVIVSVSFQAMIFSVLLLAYGFLSRFVRLWEPLNRYLVVRVRKPITAKLQTWISKLEGRPLRKRSLTTFEIGSGVPSMPVKHHGTKFFLLNKPLSAALVFTRLNIDCLASFFGELFWLTILLTWGTMRIHSTISVAQNKPELQDEKLWNFGQTLPVLLLIGPFLMVARSFTATSVQHDPRLGWKPSEKQQQQATRQDTLQSEDFSSSDLALVSGKQESKRVPELTFPAPHNLGTSLSTKSQQRDHYSNSPWAGACMVSAFISFVFIIGMTFASLIDFQRGLTNTGRSVSTVWVEQGQLIVFMVIFYPLSMHIAILFGLYHDDTCARYKYREGDEACRHKWPLCAFTLFVNAVFITLYCCLQFVVRDVYIIPAWGLLLVGLALGTIFYVIYAGMALLHLRSVRKQT